MTNHGELSETGPGWAVTDYNGNVKPGRWSTYEAAWGFGMAGRYLLSGDNAVRVES